MEKNALARGGETGRLAGRGGDFNINFRQLHPRWLCGGTKCSQWVWVVTRYESDSQSSLGTTGRERCHSWWVGKQGRGATLLFSQSDPTGDTPTRNNIILPALAGHWGHQLPGLRDGDRARGVQDSDRQRGREWVRPANELLVP